MTIVTVDRHEFLSYNKLHMIQTQTMSSSKVRSRFGKWLNEARTRRGWSMVRLADAAGYDQGYISKLEGEQHPSQKAVEDLARALECEPDEGLRAAGYATQGPTISLSADAIDLAKAYDAGDAATVLRKLAERLSEGQ